VDLAPNVPQDRVVQEVLRAQMAVNPKKLRPYDEPPPVRRPLVATAPDSAATGFLVVAVLWLLAATGIGLLWIALQLFPQQLTLAFDLQLPIVGTLGFDLGPRSVESGFVNAIVYGWLSNAGFAAVLFVTPRLTGTRLAGEPIAWAALAAWNVGVAAGLVAVYFPDIASTGLLSEFPLPVDGLLLLGLLAMNAAFWPTLLGARQRIPYVSVWFYGIALLAFLGIYALGAGLPVLGLDDTAAALLSGFVARAIQTYWLLGVALGTLFYIVPRATGNPLASSGMAMLAWLLWAGLAGLSALGALVDPSVPYAITSLGNVGTMLLVAPVLLAVSALALTITGRWSLLLATGTLSFAVVAMAFLLGTALLEAIGALRSVQLLVRGTEWGDGVWMWSTLGAATFAMFAFADHAAPRVLRRDWRGSVVTDAQLWAGFSGAALAGLALMAGGVAHGSLLADGAPAEQVTGTVAWFLVAAGAGMGLVALAGLAAVVNLFLIYTTARLADYQVAQATQAAAGQAAPAAAGH
jgi:cytochrome c oxidase cbb3-type subunit 1